jgi:hypothetical protein
MRQRTARGGNGMRNEDRRDRPTSLARSRALSAARPSAAMVASAASISAIRSRSRLALILTVNLRTLALFERAITEVTIAPPPPTGAASPRLERRQAVGRDGGLRGVDQRHPQPVPPVLVAHCSRRHLSTAVNVVQAQI